MKLRALLYLLIGISPLFAVYARIGGMPLTHTGLSMALSGGTLIVGEGQTNGAGCVEVIDAGIVETPQSLATVEVPDSVLSVVIVGRIVYAACADAGLRIIDISTPSHPVIIEAPFLDERVVQLCKQDELLYVSSESGIRIYDITIPDTPVIRACLEVDGVPRLLAAGQDRLYIAPDESLSIYNTSDMSHPSLLSEYSASSPVTALSAEGSMVFLGDRTGALSLVDVADAAHPVLVGSCSSACNPTRLIIRDNRVYLIGGDRGLRSIDVSDPRYPFIDGFYSSDSRANALSITNNRALVIDSKRGLLVIDVTDTHCPTVLSEIRTPGSPKAITVRGEYALIADCGASMLPVNITNPFGPVALPECPELAHAQSACFVGAYALVTDDECGLGVLECGDFTDMCLRGSWMDYLPGHTISKDRAMICIAADERGVLLADVSDPRRPVHAGGWITLGNAIDAVLKDNIVYVAVQPSCLQIVDVSDPRHPEVQAMLNVSGEVSRIAVKNRVVYLAAGDAGLHVIDASDPTEPQLVSTFRPHADSHVTYCYRNGDRLYSFDTAWNEIDMFDIADADEPEMIDFYNGSGALNGMCEQGAFLYVVDDAWGMQILAIGNVRSRADVEYYSAIKAFPNPFNPETTISYSINEPGEFTVSIYDLRGRRVRLLEHGMVNTGEHLVTWDGTDEHGQAVGSGVYLCRVATMGNSAVQRLVLVK
jgi:hypothetical protein